MLVMVILVGSTPFSVARSGINRAEGGSSGGADRMALKIFEGFDRTGRFDDYRKWAAIIILIDHLGRLVGPLRSHLNHSVDIAEPSVVGAGSHS